jgi:hypothetical protein
LATISNLERLKWIFQFHAPTGIYGSCGESPTKFYRIIGRWREDNL